MFFGNRVSSGVWPMTFEKAPAKMDSSPPPPSPLAFLSSQTCLPSLVSICSGRKGPRGTSGGLGMKRCSESLFRNKKREPLQLCFSHEEAAEAAAPETSLKTVWTRYSFYCPLLICAEIPGFLPPPRAFNSTFPNQPLSGVWERHRHTLQNAPS